MRLILSFALILIFEYARAQSPVVSAEQMNVFYVGLENPIKVAIPRVPFNKTAVKISEGTLVKTDSNFHVLIPERRVNECLVSVGKIKKGDTIWLYKKKFKVRNVPRPQFRIGPIDFHYPVRLSTLFSQSKAYAILENFVYEGVKFTIQKYHMHVFDPQKGYLHYKYTESKTSAFYYLLSDISEKSIIFFDSIEAMGPGGIVHLESETCRLVNTPPDLNINIITSDSVYHVFNDKSILYHLPVLYTLVLASDEYSLKQEFNTNGIFSYSYKSETEIRKWYFEKNNNDAVIVHGEDSAVGRLIHNDQLSISTGIEYRYNRFFSQDSGIRNFNCDDVSDSVRYLSSVFADVKNWAFPIAEWNFYRNGKLYANGITEMVNQEDKPNIDGYMFGNFICPEWIYIKKQFYGPLGNGFRSAAFYLIPGYNFHFYKQPGK